MSNNLFHAEDFGVLKGPRDEVLDDYLTGNISDNVSGAFSSSSNDSKVPLAENKLAEQKPVHQPHWHEVSLLQDTIVARSRIAILRIFGNLPEPSVAKGLVACAILLVIILCLLIRFISQFLSAPAPFMESEPEKEAEEDDDGRSSVGGFSSVTLSTPSCRAVASAISSRGRRESKCKIVLNRFNLSMAREEIIGEGRLAICRKGLDMQTGKEIAVKIYKAQTLILSKELCFATFRWQVEVLQRLHDGSDAFNIHPELAIKQPSDLFVELVDFSRDADADGVPGLDDECGFTFVVMEICQYTLADYLAERVDFSSKLPLHIVQDIVKALVVIVAGLHAKGLVHLNLKPDSFGSFNGRLKLISTDNCVELGSRVSIKDSALGHSPSYCSPEWARFMHDDSIDDPELSIDADPATDVWSIGLTICDLITPDTVLKQMYSKFLRQTQSHQEAGLRYMQWLSYFAQVPLPKEIKDLDRNLFDLLKNWMLVYDEKQRKASHECLSHCYLEAASDERKLPVAMARQDTPFLRNEDFSRRFSQRGTIWKLNTGGNPEDPTQWLQRDMWISSASSLCYFSMKDNKRLVLLDGGKLQGAVVSPFRHGARKHAFQIQTRPDEDEKLGIAVFACSSDKECEIWMAKLQRLTIMSRPTEWLGGTPRGFGNFGRRFSLQVRNKRRPSESASESTFFRGLLWKVKGNGDRMNKEDWFQRDMWICADGSLAYWSEKEQQELCYYTAADVIESSVSEIDDNDSFRPWSFQVQLPPAGEVCFHPGEFAANSFEDRERWIAALRDVAVNALELLKE